MRKLILGGLIFAASTTLVQAQETEKTQNWTFLEAGYGIVNLDNTPVNMKGFGIQGSVETSEFSYLTGYYSRYGDNKDLDVSATSFSLGGGVKYGINDLSDIYFGASYYGSKVTSPADINGSSVSGYQIRTGVKSVLANRFLTDIGLVYDNTFDKNGVTYKGEFSVGAEVLYKLTERVALGFGATYAGSGKSYLVKARFSF